MSHKPKSAERRWIILAQDGRHDLWIADPEAGAQLVLDRHHVLYAYGPLDDFVRELSAAGFERGEIAIPSPHAHHYHADFDADERAIVGHFAWRKSDLRHSDVQWEEPLSNTEGGG